MAELSRFKEERDAANQRLKASLQEQNSKLTKQCFQLVVSKEGWEGRWRAS